MQPWYEEVETNQSNSGQWWLRRALYTWEELGWIEKVLQYDCSTMLRGVVLTYRGVYMLQNGCEAMFSMILPHWKRILHVLYTVHSISHRHYAVRPRAHWVFSQVQVEDAGFPTTLPQPVKLWEANNWQGWTVHRAVLSAVCAQNIDYLCSGRFEPGCLLP